MKTIYLLTLLSISTFCYAQGPLLVPCLLGEKWGYCDTNAVVVIPAAFDYAGHFRNKHPNGLSSFDVWYAPVSDGKSSNWIDTRGRKLFDFELIDGIEYRPLNARLCTIALRFYGKTGQKTAVFDSKLHQITAFESASITYPGKWDDLEVWWNSEEQGVPQYASADRWNDNDFGQNFLIEYENGLQGILDSNAQVLVRPKFLWVSNIYDHRYIAKTEKNSTWLIIKWPKKIIDTFRYGPVTGINNGLVGVRKFQKGEGDRYGFVDLKNKLKIPFKYTEIFGFNRGIAIGKRPDGGWDLFDTKGKVQFTLQKPEDLAPYPRHFFIKIDSINWKGFDYKFYPFPQDSLGGPPLTLIREGKICYRFKIGEDSVYVDTKGKELGRHPYNYIQQVEYSFSNGKKNTYPNLFFVKQKNKWGFAHRINSYSFQEVVEPKLDHLFGFNNGYSSNSIDGRWGVFDTLGNIIIPFEWDKAKVTYKYPNFDSMWIEVGIGNRIGSFNMSGKTNLPCVLKESTQKVKIDGNLIWLDSLNFINYLCNGMGNCLQFDSSYHFQALPLIYDGLNTPKYPCFFVKRNNQTGLMDKLGKWITEPVHERCNITANGKYYITLDTGVWTFRKRENNYILDQSFWEYQIVGDDISQISYPNNEPHIRIWSESRNIFLASDHWMERIRGHRIHYNTENGWGFYDEKMHTVIPPIYERVQGFLYGTAIVTKNGYTGAIDSMGRIVVPIEYENLFPLKRDYFIAYSNAALQNYTLLKAGPKVLAKNVLKVDTISGNRFLLSYRSGPNSIDTAKLETSYNEDEIIPGTYIGTPNFMLIDGEGNILIEHAERIFPTTTGAAYIKGGAYFEYGRKAGEAYKEIYNIATLRYAGTDSLIWVGINNREHFNSGFSFQGLLNKDSSILLPVTKQHIEIIPETGEFYVGNDHKVALFNKKGQQKCPYQFDSNIEIDPEAPFCYYYTQKDPSDKFLRIEKWITTSGRPIGIKRKWYLQR